VVVPLTTTDALARGDPVWSVTVPVTVLCCASAGVEQRKIPIMAMRILVFITDVPECGGRWGKSAATPA
jgi:hypothetical protein